MHTTAAPYSLHESLPRPTQTRTDETKCLGNSPDYTRFDKIDTTCTGNYSTDPFGVVRREEHGRGVWWICEQQSSLARECCVGVRPMRIRS